MPIGWTDVVLGLVPGVAWLVFVVRKDVHEPEPRHALARAFALGCAAAWAAHFLRPRLEWALLPPEDGLHAALVDAFLVTASSEEVLKLAAVLLGALWHRQWNEPMDGIVYGAAAGLGFAALENAAFLASSGSWTTVLVRAFTANLGHAAFTAIAASLVGIGLARGRPVLIGGGGLALAVAFHGVYDLFVFSFPDWSVVALLGVLPLALLLLGWKIRWALHSSPFRIGPRRGEVRDSDLAA